MIASFAASCRHFWNQAVLQPLMIALFVVMHQALSKTDED